MNPDGRKVYIEHGDPCRCRIDEHGAIYVALPCRRFGHRVTKRRLAQMLHALRKAVALRNTDD